MEEVEKGEPLQVLWDQKNYAEMKAEFSIKLLGKQ